MSPIGRRISASFGLLVVALALTFGVAAPPERCPAISVDDTRAAATAAADWLIGNQAEDGRWLYEYDRARDVAFDDYNIVRHAGVMTALYQAGGRGIDGATESADRGLAWILDHIVERDDWSSATTSRTLQVGTNALLVAALAERRLHTGDEIHDDLMARLGRFIEAQTEPTGAVLAYYDVDDQRPRSGVYSIYYTGEAYWALGRLHRADPGAGWGHVADRVGNYMATVRDDAEDIWPPLADHWSGYGLAETAAFPERPAGTPLTDAELQFVRRQAGLIGQRVRSISQRFGPWGPLVRGTFTPRGGGYGVFGEGLAGLWRAAELEVRLASERETIGERAVCIVGLAIEAQSDGADAATYAAPGRVQGAWFIDDVTRMDDQQHALSALLFAIPILEAAPVDLGHPAPSWGLWAIVVLGVLNPIRVASAAPPRDRVGTRVATVATGVAVGLAIVVAVGSLSGWAVDLVDTSRPALRLGAAALCLLVAGIDVARPGADESEVAGWPGTVVPIALPLTARPVLLVTALSVVADHSLWFLLMLAAIGVGGAAAAASGVPAGGAARGGWRWGSRLVSSIALVAATLLVAHAVFDL